MFDAIMDIMFTTLIIRKTSTSFFKIDQLGRMISFVCFNTGIIFKKKKTSYICISCTAIQHHSFLFENVYKNAF